MNGVVALIDYGSGNLRSAEKALARAAGETGSAQRMVVTSDPDVVSRAERIVLPGVGAFGDCMNGLSSIGGMVAALEDAVRKRGVPFLGICVGMQWLYAGSSEAPGQPGLGRFAESCTRFPEGFEKVPHVGWNSLETRPGSRLFAGVEPGEYVYFTHSYKGPVTADTAAVTHYIEPFAAAVERANVMGVQFHPEKSGATGLKILRNFLKVER